MSPCPLFHSSMELSFPRVSGDEPERRKTLRKANQFSPRERG